MEIVRNTVRCQDLPSKRLKQLESENNRLKGAIADLIPDNHILKEAAEGSRDD